MVRRSHGRAGFHARKGGKVRTAVYRPPTAKLGGAMIVPLVKAVAKDPSKLRKAVQLLTIANEVRKAIKKLKRQRK